MRPAPCLLVLLLFACSTMHGAAAQDEVQYNSEPGNIQGEVLVLDVSSLRFQMDTQPGAPVDPMFRTYDLCATACKNLAFCNAWVHCSKPEGCGSGCKSYAEHNPKLARNPDNPSQPNPEWSFPYTSAGPFGPTADCVAAPGAAEADAWPFGTCTLKVLPDPAHPTYWSTDATEGWISGTVVLPPICKDISAGMCEACATVKDPVRCRACARGPRMIQQRGMMVADPLVGYPGHDMAESGCLTCWNKSAAPGRCTSCLSDYELAPVCSNCPVDMSQEGDVDACITCATKFGKTQGMYSACLSCAKLPDTAAINKCIACLSKVPQVACADGVKAWEVNDTCKDASDAGLDCGDCAIGAADFGACTTCMVTPPLTWGCGACAALPTAADQAWCYKCRRDSGMGGGECSAVHSAAPATRDRLLACMTDPTITQAGRSWCNACISGWYADKDKDGTLAAKCVECLRSNPTTGFVETCQYLS